MPLEIWPENSAVRNKTKIAATRKNRLKNNAIASSTNAPLNAVPKMLQKLPPLKPASSSTTPSARTKISNVIKEAFIDFRLPFADWQLKSFRVSSFQFSAEPISAENLKLKTE